MSPQPRLCILSTGRSGSRYISKVLTRAGVPCGHEHYYSPTNHHPNGYVAESSWLALPRVESGHFTGSLAHQVRHPLRIISSFMNGQMKSNAAKPYAHFQQINLRAGHYPEPRTDEEWLVHIVRYVVEWSHRCEMAAAERGGFTYRVEDVDTELVWALAELAEVDVNLGRVLAAVEGTSDWTNKHPDGPGYRWDDLPDIHEVDNLMVMAGRWGYL